VRGFRVEPGEIEMALAAHPRVSQAAVIMREDRPGDRRLVGYVITDAVELGEGNGGPLREFVAGRLPDYMVPAAVLVVPDLPMTVNGKLDRAALPAPQFAGGRAGRGPATAAEGVLCELFAEVLGLNSVGTEDSFFELGGDSLSVMRLLDRIRTVLDAEIGVRELFTTPTPSALAGSLAGSLGGSRDRAADDFAAILPLRTGGGRPPLFCVHPGQGLSWRYAGLADRLPEDYPVYGLQARGLAGPEDLPESIEEMAADYFDRIRAVQPTGPYHLLGWSFGGVVAQAIAAHAESQGAQVALLASLDGYPFRDLAGAPGAAADGPREGGPQERVQRRLEAGVRVPDGAAAVRRTLSHIETVGANNERLMRNFTPSPVRCDLLLFVAASGRFGSASADDAPRAWRPYVRGRIRSHLIDSDHHGIMDAGPLTEIARVLTEDY
jgi:thioesterase domain-containing protein